MTVLKERIVLPSIFCYSLFFLLVVSLSTDLTGEMHLEMLAVVGLVILAETLAVVGRVDSVILYFRTY